MLNETPFIHKLGLCLFFSSFVFQYMWCAFVAGPGKKYFSDVPNERSSHTQVTPRSGGFTFGLLIAFAFAVAAVFKLIALTEAALLISSFIILSYVGLIDDVKNLNAKTRFLGHFISTLLVVSAMYLRLSQHFPFSTADSILFYLCFGLFGTASINFYNFADGINGFVGLQGFLTALLFSFFYIVSPGTNISLSAFIIALSIAPALIVFLYFNLVKKNLFMGDSGSTVLGLLQLYAAILPFYLLEHAEVLAAASLGKTTTLILISFSTIILFSAVIFMDCSSMVISKFLLRFPLSKPHREHIYQRLSRKPKATHFKISILLFIVQLILTSGFLYLIFTASSSVGLIALQFTLLIVFFILAFKSNYKAFKEAYKRT